MKSVVMGAAVATAMASIALAPPASAMEYGNYNLIIPDRRDFHTWILSATMPCRDGNNQKIWTCIDAMLVPQPVAKAVYSHSKIQIDGSTYSMTVDDPFGLRCGDIYYGPTVPTHDVYTWDGNTRAGQMVSTFDEGCDGAPGGSLTYPFTLERM
ncbi:hypothetical protein [Mycolicibacterium insubricum]|uniref:Uncharacterized protein n=1 Tax=Mycolicibacterium insubricum TaxID=444597 RepID=A0A1X0CY17_9MYCO|nr:hypothetical protein [Mycolicibacterium insubricum]ORA65046.1 hypothetical protein BST26_19225 [Mycolicibacterium insubricum]